MPTIRPTAWSTRSHIDLIPKEAALASYQLMYFSTAVQPVSAGDILDILAVSRARNAAACLQGLLIATAAHFIQVLEGEEAAVRQLYGRICSDSRHHHCTIIHEGPVSEAEFESWDPAFYSPCGSGDPILAAAGIATLDEEALRHLVYDRSQARALMAAALLEAGRGGTDPVA